jgi:hypothetical protein
MNINSGGGSKEPDVLNVLDSRKGAGILEIVVFELWDSGRMGGVWP